MTKNRIEVFNRSIADDIEDAVVFRELVGDKYDLFCLVYHMLEDFIEVIDDIRCDVKKNHLVFKITLNADNANEICNQISVPEYANISLECKDSSTIILDIHKD